MKISGLISCNNCGMVLDSTKCGFPEEDEIWDEKNHVIDDLLAAYDGENWVPFIYCPLCDEKILKTQDSE